jgi:hypothetical protein
MRALVLLSACLLAAAAVAQQDDAEPKPAPRPTYSPQTQSTLDWLGSLDAAAARQAELEPPVTMGTPAPDPTPGIHRCAGADGTAVFTDRSCEAVGAVASAAPSAGNASTRIFVRSCARTREALLNGLRDALDAQDANRVASYYHWTGMGNRAAYALMDRLQGFSERPLVDVQLMASADLARDSAPPDAPRPWLRAWPPFTEVEPPAPHATQLDLIRVDQMSSYNDASSQVTYFHLQPNAGCWWIRF